MKIEGRCHCGEISFEAEVDPNRVALCHCTDCQAISGAPFRASVPAPAEKLTLRGEPRTYVKTGDSGNKRLHGFCGTCGSAIYAANPEKTVFNLRLGAIRQRAELVPKHQGFCRSAIPWAMDVRDIPQVPDAKLPPKKA